MERHQEFDYYLEDCYPNVQIAGITFSPADILAECDPIAYRCTLNDWVNHRCMEGFHEQFEGDSACKYCGESLELEDDKETD